MIQHWRELPEMHNTILHYLGLFTEYSSSLGEFLGRKRQPHFPEVDFGDDSFSEKVGGDVTTNGRLLHGLELEG